MDIANSSMLNLEGKNTDLKILQSQLFMAGGCMIVNEAGTNSSTSTTYALDKLQHVEIDFAALSISPIKSSNSATPALDKLQDVSIDLAAYDISRLQIDKLSQFRPEPQESEKAQLQYQLLTHRNQLLGQPQEQQSQPQQSQNEQQSQNVQRPKEPQIFHQQQPLQPQQGQQSQYVQRPQEPQIFRQQQPLQPQQGQQSQYVQRPQEPQIFRQQQPLQPQQGQQSQYVRRPQDSQTFCQQLPNQQSQQYSQQSVESQLFSQQRLRVRWFRQQEPEKRQPQRPRQQVHQLAVKRPAKVESEPVFDMEEWCRQFVETQKREQRKWQRQLKRQQRLAAANRATVSSHEIEDNASKPTSQEPNTKGSNGDDKEVPELPARNTDVKSQKVKRSIKFFTLCKNVFRKRIKKQAGSEEI